MRELPGQAGHVAEVLVDGKIQVFEIQQTEVRRKFFWNEIFGSILEITHIFLSPGCGNGRRRERLQCCPSWTGDPGVACLPQDCWRGRGERHIFILFWLNLIFIILYLYPLLTESDFYYLWSIYSQRQGNTAASKQWNQWLQRAFGIPPCPRQSRLHSMRFRWDCVIKSKAKTINSFAPKIKEKTIKRYQRTWYIAGPQHRTEIPDGASRARTEL